MLEQPAAAFGVVGRAVGDWWRDWVKAAVVNLAWVVCCATVVLAPPATFALYHYAHEVRRGRVTTPTELFSAGRRMFVKSWLWALLNLLAVLLVWANLLFYGRLESPLALIVYPLLALAVALWLAVQFYAPPYLMAQQTPSLRRAYRNALFTTLASPLYTLILLLIVGVLVALGLRLFVLLFLGLPCLIAVLGACAVAERLEVFGVS